MAKLKARYATVEEIPEADKDRYVEQDGAWIVDIDPVDGFVLEDTKGLRTALTDHKHNAAEAKQKLAVWGELDPEKVRADMTELVRMREAKPSDKQAEQWAAKERELAERHTTEMGTRDKTIKTLTGDLHTEVGERSAIEAIIAADGSVDLMLPHVMRAVRVKEEGEGADRRRVAVVLDEQGREQVSMRPGQSGRMTIKEYVERMSKTETFAAAFKAEGISGSGTSGRDASGGGGTGGGPNKFQLSKADARDPVKYAAMREQASKAGQLPTIAADD